MKRVVYAFALFAFSMGINLRSPSSAEAACMSCGGEANTMYSIGSDFSYPGAAFDSEHPAAPSPFTITDYAIEPTQPTENLVAQSVPEPCSVLLNVMAFGTFLGAGVAAKRLRLPNG